MDLCVICQQSIEDGHNQEIVKLTEKGVQGILTASRERGDQLDVSTGHIVHVNCRKRYCNKRSIASDAKPVKRATKRTLRSQTEQFHIVPFVGKVSS